MVIGPDVADTPRVLARGEGNPFFLEELARAVAERRESEMPAEVPDTLHGVLMARIDRLAEAPRRVLQTAAVLGREFSPRLLGAIWRGRGELDHHLAELRRLEFLYEQPDISEPRWVFKHALTQDVAYASMLSSRRSELHEAAAGALEVLAGDRREDVQELLAFHYSRTELHDRAVEHLGAAAAQSFRRHAHTEAARALEEALDHAERLPEEARDRQLVELTLRLSDSFYFLGRFDESAERLERVRRRVEELADPRLSGRYHFAVGLVHSHVGSSEDTVRSAEAAIAEAGRCGDVETEGRAQYVLARDAFWTSRLRECVEHGRRGASLLARAGDRWWEGQCHCFASLALIHAGDLDRALACIDRGRAIGEAMGDLRLQSYADWNLALAEATRLNTDLAIAVCTRSVETSPDPLNTAFAAATLGQALLEHGDPAGALPLLQRSTETLYGFGVRHTGGWWDGYLAEARLRTGDLVGAREQASQALDTTRSTGHRWATGVALRVLGRTAHAEDDLDEAETRLRGALETFTSIGARLEIGVTRLDLARCADAQGRPDQVAAHLERAREVFARLPAPRWSERVEALAAELTPLRGGSL
jgi:tetratricopeptide (TPR) repeat protein